MHKTILCGIIFIVLVLNCVLLNPLGSISTFSDGTTVQPRSYLISNVPYVCQETDFYCAYACPTMIFNYYHINTTLAEVVYNSGVGYALLYSPPYAPRLPVGCIGSCKWGNDRRFLAGLYGFSYEDWRADSSESEQQRWEAYWMRVKQNISENKPVITSVDPMNLPSLRNAIRKHLGVTSGLWMRISDVFWDSIPSYMYHAILLVGYNEENHTVCYHDPSAGLYGCPEIGTYAWMDLKTFRRALNRLYIDSPLFSYVVETFADTPDPPLDKQNIFLLAHERNIEKLKGNRSVYESFLYEQWNDTKLGIQGLQQMRADISGSLANRMKTIRLYIYLVSAHFLTAEYRLDRLLQSLLPPTSNFSTSPTFVNKFKQISLEKQTIISYLQAMQSAYNDTRITRICQKDAELLLFECENWSALATSYNIFLKKGVFFSAPRALLVLRHMLPAVEHIIHLEQELSGPVAI